MREENRSEIIHDAINFLDDEMIEEVNGLRGGVSVENVSTQTQVQDENDKMIDFTSKNRYPWRKWVALAASICLIVIVGNAWEISNGGKPNTNDDLILDENVQDGMEGEPSDLVGNADGGLGQDDNFGSSDFDENLSDVNNPTLSDNTPIRDIMNLLNYSAVIYLDKPATDFAEMAKENLPEDVCEIVDKFLDSAQRGNVVLVDSVSWGEAVENADGHLYFELENGKNAHLVLIGDGKICNYDTKTAWIEMDKRIYRILVEALKEE